LYIFGDQSFGAVAKNSCVCGIRNALIFSSSQHTIHSNMCIKKKAKSFISRWDSRDAITKRLFCSLRNFAGTWSRLLRILYKDLALQKSHKPIVWKGGVCCIVFKAAIFTKVGWNMWLGIEKHTHTLDDQNREVVYLSRFMNRTLVARYTHSMRLDSEKQSFPGVKVILITGFPTFWLQITRRFQWKRFIVEPFRLWWLWSLWKLHFI
jgi:hypothetical protein